MYRFTSVAKEKYNTHAKVQVHVPSLTHPFPMVQLGQMDLITAGYGFANKTLQSNCYLIVYSPIKSARTDKAPMQSPPNAAAVGMYLKDFRKEIINPKLTTCEITLFSTVVKVYVRTCS